ncbi:MAG: carbohydrate ABC transporter permease [Candidatus Bipolaricaulota bacterium]|nr:carbohydrate ABC transporter permease [Candidatus Bipolaricaulota bacterium]MDW8126778.1 carbohydrate ABC transporter permease [Candidatus Bipolaricaulota bacterium]
MKRYTFRALVYLGVIFFLVIALFPISWVFIGSMHSTADLLKARVAFPPRNPTLEHYSALFRAQYGVKLFSRYIINSLKVGMGTAALTMMIAVLGAYGLSRYRFVGREILSRLMLFIYVFPQSLILVPAYVLLARLKLIDSHVGLILVHTGLAAPFCTWLVRSFFDAIPKELEEAASVEGANWFHVLFRIILPLAAPGVVTAGVYALVLSWGEYMFAVNFLMSGVKWTVPAGLATYMTEQAIEWGQLLAGTVLTAVPILLIFFPFARAFLRGFLEGALR